MTSPIPARDRLFAAAKDLYGREGLQALSLREVGRLAGMSAMAIYRHFPDKDALVDALLHDGLSAWTQIVASIEHADPIAWLRLVIDAYRDFALQQPHRFDAAFLLPARHASTFSVERAASPSPVVNAIVARIAQAQAEDRLVDGAPLRLALLISAMAQGLVSMHRARRFGSEAAFVEDYRFAMDRLLQALVKQPAARSRATTKKRKATR